MQVIEWIVDNKKTNTTRTILTTLTSVIKKTIVLHEGMAAGPNLLGTAECPTPLGQLCCDKWGHAQTLSPILFFAQNSWCIYIVQSKLPLLKCQKDYSLHNIIYRIFV